MEVESSLKKLDNVIEKLKRDEEKLRRLAKRLGGGGGGEHVNH